MDADQAIRNKLQNMIPLTEIKEEEETETKIVEKTNEDVDDFSSIPLPIIEQPKDIMESRKHVDKLISDKRMNDMLNHLM